MDISGGVLNLKTIKTIEANQYFKQGSQGIIAVRYACTTNVFTKHKHQQSLERQVAVFKKITVEEALTQI